MSKHTPGPWIKNNWAILDEANKTVICNVLPWDASGCREEDIDNARLIAAAPELLEALEALVCKFGKYGFAFTDEWFMKWVGDAIAVIAKAKG